MKIERANRRKATDTKVSVDSAIQTITEAQPRVSPRSKRGNARAASTPSTIGIQDASQDDTQLMGQLSEIDQPNVNPPPNVIILYQEEQPHVRAWLVSGIWQVCIEGNPEAPSEGWYSATSNGELVRQHYSKGKLHNQGGPAEFRVSSSRQSETHSMHGVVSNHFGPAITVQFVNGEKIERYVVNDEDQRTVVTYPDGSTLERYSAGSLSKGSVVHRDGGPAIIRKNPTGMVLLEEYYFQGKLHRSGDKPAVIQGRRMEYRDRGELHRVAGPALITESGQQYYYLEGKEVSKTSVSKAHLSDTGASGVGEAPKEILAHGNHEERRAEMASRVDAWASSKGRKLMS